MIEVEYVIGDMKTAMIIVDEHSFYRIKKEWVNAVDVEVGDILLTCSGDEATVIKTQKIDATRNACTLKISHNHHYFVTNNRGVNDALTCNSAPVNPLELIPYNLADKPSKYSNGKPTPYHSGPWVAARYFNSDGSVAVIGWGRADDSMCAEDAAVSDLRGRLDKGVELHRGNVEISHAYVRKYTRKGRRVNKISPCVYCRDNYGRALNDTTVGHSDLMKRERGYLPEP